MGGFAGAWFEEEIGEGFEIGAEMAFPNGEQGAAARDGFEGAPERGRKRLTHSCVKDKQGLGQGKGENVSR